MKRTTLFGTFVLVCGSLVIALPLGAQDCIGLSRQGNGMLTYGFQGTDGATGYGLDFAFHAFGASVQIQRRSLEAFTVVDRIDTYGAQVAIPIATGGLAACVVAGMETTSYDNERLVSRSWSSDFPTRIVEEHRIGGPYRRVRVPIGLAFGREFHPLDRLSIVPYLIPAIVLQQERLEPEGEQEREREAFTYGLSGGVAFVLDWFVLRSSIAHTMGPDALSGRNNFPSLSIHLGVSY